MGLLSGWQDDQRRRGLMPSTIYRRSTMVRSWLRWCEDRGLDPLAATSADVDRFVDARRVGSRTRYTWLSALHVFYEWAIREGHHHGEDPTARIARPKLRQTLPRPIGDDDLAVAIALATGHVRVWLVLAAYAGLRCAEIAALQRDDVLWSDELLRVTGKGSKDRLVPMHPLVVEHLRAWTMPRQNRAIFQRPAGGAWTPALVSAHGNAYLRSVGVDATMHQLRHWFGTRTLQASRNLRTVQGLMGHASPTTTAIYTAWDAAEARSAVGALAELRASA